MKKYLFIFLVLTGIIFIPKFSLASGEFLNQTATSSYISYLADSYVEFYAGTSGFISSVKTAIIQTNGTKNIWITLSYGNGGNVIATSSIVSNINFNGGVNEVEFSFAPPVLNAYPAVYGPMLYRITFYGGANIVGLGESACGTGDITSCNPYLIISGNTSAYSQTESSTSSLSLWTSSSSPFYVDCSAYDDVAFFSSGTIGMIACSIQKNYFRNSWSNPCPK